MSKGKLITLGLLIAGILAVVTFAILSFTKSRKPTAGLKVETNPDALVFVDNTQIGQTPLDKKFVPGEVTVKIIPTVNGEQLSTYQTKVKLVDNVYTVIKRDFGKTDLESAGDTVSLQSQSGDSASLAVVTSSPDSAAVSVDGQSQGFTPLLVSSIPTGDHQIVITAPGYSPRTISALAIGGYKLTINAKLAVMPQAVVDASPSATPILTPSATSSATPKLTPSPTTAKTTPSSSPKPTTTLTVIPTPTPSIVKPYVQILNTPVGFLRVRSGPSTNNDEVGQVKPTETYSLLGTQADWYQIKVDLEATSSGWISSQYAKKYE